MGFASAAEATKPFADSKLARLSLNYFFTRLKSAGESIELR